MFSEGKVPHISLLQRANLVTLEGKRREISFGLANITIHAPPPLECTSLVLLKKKINNFTQLCFPLKNTEKLFPQHDLHVRSVHLAFRPSPLFTSHCAKVIVLILNIIFILIFS